MALKFDSSVLLLILHACDSGAKSCLLFVIGMWKPKITEITATTADEWYLKGEWQCRPHNYVYGCACAHVRQSGRASCAGFHFISTFLWCLRKNRGREFYRLYFTSGTHVGWCDESTLNLAGYPATDHSKAFEEVLFPFSKPRKKHVMFKYQWLQWKNSLQWFVFECASPLFN